MYPQGVLGGHGKRCAVRRGEEGCIERVFCGDGGVRNSFAAEIKNKKIFQTTMSQY